MTSHPHPVSPPDPAGNRAATAARTVVFGDLLRQHRLAAGLTQEELAERATLSLRGISDLERGVKTRPQRETIRLLAEALALGEAERDTFEAVARQRPFAGTGAPPGLPAWPDALPAVAQPFVGRAEDIGAVTALLHDSSVRIATLTGPGGVGKTRLALEVTAVTAGAFADGIAFVPLAAVRDPALTPAAIATALGIPARRDEPLRDTVLAALAPRVMLLLMDNFEQITAAAGFVAALLAHCPRVTVLATSRVPLHVRGEREYALAPLGLPAVETPATVALTSAAVALFVARAQQAKPDFTLTDVNAPAVAAICARLDGLPLAIELAAARVRLLPPTAMRARLESRLALLTGGGATLPPRQRTMRDAIAWSYDLLEAREQRLFRFLGVCIGGCTIEAAEALWGEDPDPTANVLGWVDALTDKSLLRVEEHEDGVRLAMLEVIREFAGERLAAAGEETTVRRAHAAHYAALAERGRRGARGSDQREWRDRLERESANFRTALTWARDAGEVEMGLRIAGYLWRFWYTHGHYEEGQTWLESLLALDSRVGHIADTATRARALNGAGFFALAVSGDYTRAISYNEEALILWQRLGRVEREADTLDYLAEAAKSQGDTARAMALLDESLTKRRLAADEWGMADTFYRIGGLRLALGDLAGASARYEECLQVRRRVRDTVGTAYALHVLADVVRQQGDDRGAQAMLTESLELFEKAGDKAGMANALTNLGIIAENRRDYHRARERHEEALALYRALGNREGIANALNNLGILAYRQGDLDTATERCEQALAIARELKDRRGIAFGLSYRGAIAEATGDNAQAIRFFAESLTLCDALGSQIGVMDNFESLARLLLARQQPTEAARLFGAAAAIRAAGTLILSPADAEVHGRAEGACRAALGDDVFVAAWNAGMALPQSDAIREALASVASPALPPPT